LQIPFIISASSYTRDYVIDRRALSTALLACVLIALQDS
jgi:hypothetical protein